MIWALLLIPTVAGLLALVIPSNVVRRGWMLLGAVAHAGLVAGAWIERPAPVLYGWMAIDAAALMFLSLTSALFVAAAVYAVGYLAGESRQGEGRRDNEEDLPFENFPEAVFAACLLLFLATMTLVAVSQHLGLMWVAVEATTLASAPLIYFHRHRRSLEASWKYLVICSVGIAMALLGTFFIAVAARSSGAAMVHLTMDELVAHAERLNPLWLKAAFLLFLVGYGTKMGLAPLHTWLPDAHSEAPSVVSALLSGALLNCAFLTILRGHALLTAAGLGRFSGDLLVLFGLVSAAVAAVFIIGQSDFKRMLAYSSVEHMGILALGVGVGGIAVFGSLLHAVNHSLTKGMLFLAAGNILALYRTKSAAHIGGVLRRLPVTGVLWVAGMLAIAGSPPFGPFISELTILKGAIDAGRFAVAGIYLLTLAIVFVAMAAIVLKMTYGPATDPAGDLGLRHERGSTESTASGVAVLEQPAGGESLWSVAPLVGLGLAVLALGLYVPAGLTELLQQAAAMLGAQ